MLKHLCLPAVLLFLSCLVTTTQAAGIDSKAKLGEQLFFDPNLSLNRTQSCATCHNPAAGFSDQRGYDANNNTYNNTNNNAPNQTARNAASLGADNQSLGDRNAPTASYASQIPAFHRNSKGEYIGGQFWDGRASSLADQAAGPPLNPMEMGMPDKASVVARLQENPNYVSAFEQLFNDTVFKDTDKAYAAMTDSIAAFEQTETFAPFDSKYDRYLRGEYQPTKQEDLGMTLFFSQQFSNCNVCHQLKTRPLAAGETFSNYQYHNIGVPRNTALRALNGVDPEHQDSGLAEHINDPANRGKFKVPSLRNVAVTAPYMHNGVFQDLTTVVHFYNKYNSRSAKNQTNPETGELWRAPEVPENIALKELETGPALTSKRINALVAFLNMLTDQRYEKLLEQPSSPKEGATPKVTIPTNTAPVTK